MRSRPRLAGEVHRSGEGLLIRRAGVGEARLNATGAEAATLADGRRSVAQIAGCLRDRYDVPVEDCAQDLCALFERLVRVGLATVDP